MLIALVTRADSPKTSDLVTYGGGRSDWSLNSQDRVRIGGAESYIRLGVLVFIPNAKATLPLAITVSSRGLAGVAFFEVAPLVDALPSADNAEIRKALGLRAERDIAGLDALLKVPAKPLLQKRRRVIREQMMLFGEKMIAGLPNLYVQQRSIAAMDLSDKPVLIPGLFPKKRDDPSIPEISDAVLASLMTNRLLRPVLTTFALSCNSPHYIGYVVRAPGNLTAPASAEIRLSAGNAPAETLLTISLTPQKSWMEGDVVKFLAPPFFAAFGTLLGAVLGFRYFLRQQLVQQNQYLRQKFYERKYERREALEEFEKTYQTLIGNSETNRPSNIRQLLLDERIYTILDPKQVDELNSIFTGRKTKESDCMTAVDKFLRQNFPEFLQRTKQ